MKKKLLLTMIFALFAVVFAHDYTVYPVYDGADILSSVENSALTSQIYRTVEKHNGELGIYIVTVNSYSEYGYFNIESFAEYWYKNNQLGVGNNHTGLLFILSMSEREYDICAYGDFSHTTFTDFGKQKLADAALPYFRNDKWGTGFESFVSKADAMITMSENGNPLDVGTVYFDSEILIIALIIGCAFGVIVGLITVFVMRGKMNNIKEAKEARNYVIQNRIAISNRMDMFTHNVVTRTPINQNNSSGGGSRGGTTVGGGGFSHSSGKF